MLPTYGQLSQPRLDPPAPFTAVEPSLRTASLSPRADTGLPGHGHTRASLSLPRQPWRRAARFTLRTSGPPLRLPNSPEAPSSSLLTPGPARSGRGTLGSAPPGLLGSSPGDEAGLPRARRQLCGRGAPGRLPPDRPLSCDHREPVLYGVSRAEPGEGGTQGPESGQRLVSVECTRGPTHSWQHVPGSGSSQTVTGTGLHRASRGR